jgi:hypothetical protein
MSKVSTALEPSSFAHNPRPVSVLAAPHVIPGAKKGTP